jgi:hypothetical protein
MIRARLMADASEPVPGPPHHLLPEPAGLMHETGPREAGPGLHGQIPGHLYPGQPYSDQLPGEMLKVNIKKWNSAAEPHHSDAVPALPKFLLRSKG